ncbi:MAG: hypothetical protein GTO53_09280 [Planctomycetales bacterium]|nr:hypothetical protein [Planctomycetales bacterium]NIM09317.1 hypothetical protein [Planctomycetales bacterium]NIN08785.1 hypothetical protein [Planctomycetales bacterium]NIN77902.1 hypothetical protein [Planctomycetales bacterium]NIO35085.1 hypothetical protein [Planctomycetales bacterium]
MWMTAQGETVLQGGHATLIRAAVRLVADIIEDQEDRATQRWHFNVTPFDKLNWRVQMVLVSRIGEALLCEQVATPKHTELNDATAAVLYAAIRQSIEVEIDNDELFGGEQDTGTDKQAQPTWREMVLAACDHEEIIDLPAADSPDFDEWDVLIDCLATQVLWDADWHVVDLFLDVDPQHGEQVHPATDRIQDDFVEEPPEGNEHELLAARHALQKILEPPDDPGSV